MMDVVDELDRLDGEMKKDTRALERHVEDVTLRVLEARTYTPAEVRNSTGELRTAFVNGTVSRLSLIACTAQAR